LGTNESMNPALRKFLAIALGIAAVVLGVVAILLVGSSTSPDTALRLGFAGVACAGAGVIVLAA
jgi:uncharacterized membrane protein